MDKKIENQDLAFFEMNEAFNLISNKYGVGAAEAGAVALIEARWIMNTMVKSQYADFIAETLSSTNRAVNYMQRVIADPKLTEDQQIKELVEFGLTGAEWDREHIEQIVKDRRKEVLDIPAEKWSIRNYDLDMKPDPE